MKITEEILSTLPDEDIPTRKVLIGAFWTLVMTKGAGLASAFRDEDHQGPPVKEAGRLEEMGAKELARLALSPSLLEASVGMAAINSLIEVEEERCEKVNAFELLAKKGEGKDITIVGHFPFVPELRKIARELFVLEKRPREGDLEANKAEEVIPRSQVVGITGTAFINHTLEDLLSLCPPDSFVVLIGPTSPLTPILFDHGVDAICGSRVIDEQEAARYVAQGATFRQLHPHGVRLLTLLK